MSISDVPRRIKYRFPLFRFMPLVLINAFFFGLIFGLPFLDPPAYRNGEDMVAFIMAMVIAFIMLALSLGLSWILFLRIAWPDTAIIVEQDYVLIPLLIFRPGKYVRMDFSDVADLYEFKMKQFFFPKQLVIKTHEKSRGVMLMNFRERADYKDFCALLMERTGIRIRASARSAADAV